MLSGERETTMLMLTYMYTVESSLRGYQLNGGLRRVRTTTGKILGYVLLYRFYTFHIVLPTFLFLIKVLQFILAQRQIKLLFVQTV